MNPACSLFLPKHAFRFKGESGAAAIEAAPVPAPSPPATADDPAVLAAEMDLARQNLLKKSIAGTIVAGDTPYNPNTSNPAGATSPTTSFKTRLG